MPHQLRRGLIDFARAFHTPVNDLKTELLSEFLNDYQVAAEIAEEERQEAEKQKKKAKANAPKVSRPRRAKRPRRRR